MHRAKTAEEYIDLVKQAVFEVEELRMAMEYDVESMQETSTFVDQLESQIKALYRSMEDGTYQFVNQDLPYMPLLNRCDDRVLPFKYLLRVINETHRKGLDVEL